MDLLDLERQLRDRGEPFVVATVVWRRSPSSGQVGARAVITPDARLHGWVAGACAEPTVITEALKALGDGAPRLVFLGSPEELEEHHREGVVTVPIQCQSEGALEIYVEPVLPKPNVVVIGRSPAADSLARLTSALGWRSTLIDDGEDVSRHPSVDAVFTALDLEAAGVDESSFVVVATQGHYDEDALERALATPARYIGLVASRKRAETVLSYLRARGVSQDQIARIEAPAGLDLGHVPSDEIAVAILAELVELRAKGDLGPTEPAPAVSETHEALDPVCGMTVRVAGARHVATHEGRTFYFCSAGCKQRFEADPESFAQSG